MTSPRLAIDTDYGRYYEDPNPAFAGARYPSVTNVCGTAIAKPALTPWAAGEVAEYAFEQLPMIVKASEDPKQRAEALKLIKGRARDIASKAADRGTRVHAYAEADLLGLTPPPVDPDVALYVQQYRRFIKDFGVVPESVEASEASVVNRTVGYAGTMDFLLWLVTDRSDKPELWLIDAKTSLKRPRLQTFPEHVFQLAALRHAERMWMPPGSKVAEVDMPMAARCGVLNLRQRGYALVEIDAGPKAFAAFRAALTVTKFLHALELPTGEVRPARAEKAVA